MSQNEYITKIEQCDRMKALVKGIIDCTNETKTLKGQKILSTILDNVNIAWKALKI